MLSGHFSFTENYLWKCGGYKNCILAFYLLIHLTILQNIAKSFLLQFQENKHSKNLKALVLSKCFLILQALLLFLWLTALVFNKWHTARSTFWALWKIKWFLLRLMVPLLPTNPQKYKQECLSLQRTNTNLLYVGISFVRFLVECMDIVKTICATTETNGNSKNNWAEYAEKYVLLCATDTLADWLHCPLIITEYIRYLCLKNNHKVSLHLHSFIIHQLKG